MSLEIEVDSVGGRKGEGLESKQRNLYKKQNLLGPFRDLGPCSEGTIQTVEDLRSLIKNLNFILKAMKNH